MKELETIANDMWLYDNVETDLVGWPASRHSGPLEVLRMRRRWPSGMVVHTDCAKHSSGSRFAIITLKLPARTTRSKAFVYSRSCSFRGSSIAF